MRLKVLRLCYRRSKPRYPTQYSHAPAISTPTAEPCHLIAASGRDDYGRASATSKAHDYTVGGQRQKALWIMHGGRCRHALRGINGRTRRNRAMTHKCQCHNIQMRMNDI
eukprot:5933587-Pleurochrysis_carterae.AAC.6